MPEADSYIDKFSLLMKKLKFWSVFVAWGLVVGKVSQACLSSDPMVLWFQMSCSFPGQFMVLDTKNQLFIRFEKMEHIWILFPIA